MKNIIDTDLYAQQIAIQLRKGVLTYCVLKICSYEPIYTSDIIKRLHEVDLVVVEGTIYPLLSRLQKDGLLEHAWQESEQGPPRKYYVTTELGKEIMAKAAKEVGAIHTSLEKL